jgi:hypothetical protein
MSSPVRSLVVVVISLVALGFASSCGYRGDGAFSRGTPERLLDVSSEVVNLSVKSAAEVDELSQWVGRDQPTRAELYCSEGAPLCNEAKQALELYGVPTMLISSGTQTATLIYERVLARDCNQSFRDDLHQWRSESHPAFGCAISANIVQHVAQKQQFISPNLSDYRDAESAVNSYSYYQNTVSAKKSESTYGLGNSLLTNAKTE